MQTLRQSGRLQVLYFDLPRQVVHEAAHHNLRADILNKRYLQLQTSNDVMRDHENLSETLMRLSLVRATA